MCLCASVRLRARVLCLQIELEAELERLEENMDDTVFNRDTTEEKVIHPKLSSTASASQNGKNQRTIGSNT